MAKKEAVKKEAEKIGLPDHSPHAPVSGYAVKKMSRGKISHVPTKNQFHPKTN